MKWHKFGYMTLLGLVLVGSAMVLSAIAAPADLVPNPPADNVPGSFLVFPYVSVIRTVNAAGVVTVDDSTVIRITDTSDGARGTIGDPDGPHSVCVRIDTFCGNDPRILTTATGTRQCFEQDRHFCFTHHETKDLNVADLINFQGVGVDPACPSGEGYIVAWAETETQDPISYNSLIGSARVSHAGTLAVASGNVVEAYNAIPFQSQQLAMNAAGGPTVLGSNPAPTFDFALTFSNATTADYVAFPLKLVGDFQAVDRGDAPPTTTDLILLTLNVRSNDFNLSTHVDIKYWNENEVPFSTSRNFWCWERVPLENIASNFLESGLGTGDGSLKITTSVNGGGVLAALIERGELRGSSLRPLFHLGIHTPVVYFPEDL